MVFRRKHLRRNQRIFIAVLLIVASILFYPFTHKTEIINILMPKTRFFIPITPKFSYTVNPTINVNTIFYIPFSKESLISMAQLVQNELPIEVTQKGARLGPFLAEFNSQLDWHTINAITNEHQQPVTIPCCFISSND